MGGFLSDEDREFYMQLHGACKRIERCRRPYICRRMIHKEGKALNLTYEELHHILDERALLRKAGVLQEDLLHHLPSIW